MGIVEEGILMVDAPRHEEISMSEYENLVEDAITSAFGERCPEYAEGCFACEAWKQYDALRAKEERIAALEAKLSTASEMARLFLCIDFDHSTEHDDLLLEEVTSLARATLKEVCEDPNLCTHTAQNEGNSNPLAASPQEQTRGDGWQPMESAPKDGGTILLWCGDIDGSREDREFMTTGHWYEQWDGWTGWVDSYEGEDLPPPTHWMPLPPSPQGKE